MKDSVVIAKCLNRYPLPFYKTHNMTLISGINFNQGKRMYVIPVDVVKMFFMRR